MSASKRKRRDLERLCRSQLTGRQKLAILDIESNGHAFPSYCRRGFWLATTHYYSATTMYGLMDVGLAAFDTNRILLTPYGSKIARQLRKSAGSTLC